MFHPKGIISEKVKQKSIYILEDKIKLGREPIAV